MDMALLKTVTVVAERGSFAAAARQLSIDPSVASRHVAQVEASLGVRLFARSTRRVSLTEAGARYVARIAPLLEEVEHAREDVRALSGRPSGRLRLTASVAFTQLALLPHLSAFHDRYPDITVELWPTVDPVDLLEHAVDLAIRLAPEPSGDVISTKLMNTAYRVVAAPDWIAAHGHPDRPSALHAVPCLRQNLPGFRDRWRFRDRRGAETEVEIHGRTIISGASALREAALLGMGPALLADWAVAVDVAVGRLVDLFPAHAVTATSFTTAAWALYPSRAFLPAKTRVTLDFLRGALRR